MTLEVFLQKSKNPLIRFQNMLTFFVAHFGKDKICLDLSIVCLRHP